MKKKYILKEGHWRRHGVRRNWRTEEKVGISRLGRTDRCTDTDVSVRSSRYGQSPVYFTITAYTEENKEQRRYEQALIK